jgi:hypothetical protein
MVTTQRLWRARCDICRRTMTNENSHVLLIVQCVSAGWLFQYQTYDQIPRYCWGAYCPDHVADAPERVIPDDLRCGVTRMRKTIMQHCPGVDASFVEARVR